MNPEYVVEKRYVIAGEERIRCRLRGGSCWVTAPADTPPGAVVRALRRAEEYLARNRDRLRRVRDEVEADIERGYR